MINALFFKKTNGVHKVELDLLGATKDDIQVTNDDKILEVSIKNTIWKSWIPEWLDANSIEFNVTDSTLEISIKEK